MLDTKALAEATALIVREHFQSLVAPLIAENGELKARIAVLERRAPEKGEAGKDADPALIASMVAEAFAAIPLPKDGRDADPEAIKTMVAEAVAALPAAKDGKDAEPYAPNAELVRSLLAPLVREHVAALPAPKDGESVTIDDLRPLVDEAVSKAVAGFPVPKDGVGLAGALIDRRGNLVVTLTNGETRDLGDVVGKDADMEALNRTIAEKIAAIPIPKDGKDGRDAFQLEDFEASVMDDGRTIRFAMTAGDVQHAYHLPFPVVIDRGVYREGQAYQQGDAVTWAGSVWIAQKDTDAKPDAGDGWRLSVKRGRDGKDKA
jgi:hypothetical protein